MMKSVHYLKGLPVIGTTFSIIAAGSAPKLHLYIDKRHKKFGPIFKENMGTVSSIFLADPLAARTVFLAEGKYPKHLVPEPWEVYNKLYNCNRGLFFMEGEEWLKYRRIMNQLMLKKNSSSQHVQEFVLNNFMKSIEKFDGKVLENIEYIFYRLSIDFLVGTLMGTTYMNNLGAFEKDIDNLALVVSSIFLTTSKLMNVPIKLATSLNLKAWKDFKGSVNSSLAAGGTLLEHMKNYPLTDGLLKDLLEEDIDLTVITSLVMDLILAAGDTTAYTSQWALYLLSREPEVADRVRTDSQLVSGVIRETLRLYPAAIFLSRYLDRDLVLPNIGYHLPKGELVNLSLYTMGRLESAYPEPDKFQPERWLRQEDQGTLRYLGVLEPMAWMPFAVGSRSCIGRKLAEAQLSLIISKMISKYRLKLLEPVEMVLRLVPVPSKPIMIKIDKF